MISKLMSTFDSSFLLFCSRWTSKCFFKLDFCAKFLPHILHWCGFSLLWMSKCCFKLCVFLNLFKHMEQVKWSMIVGLVSMTLSMTWINSSSAGAASWSWQTFLCSKNVSKSWKTFWQGPHWKVSVRNNLFFNNWTEVNTGSVQFHPHSSNLLSVYLTIS